MPTFLQRRLRMATIERDGVLSYKKLDAAIEFDGGLFIKPASVDFFGGLAIDVRALSGAQYAVLLGKLAELSVPLVGTCTAPGDDDDDFTDEEEAPDPQP